ncbi:MAG TPA: LON peptidase substrate-binding domain-containing protein [Egibacteraceae bacterium]|nr:LON peptidase substrate-binding domain-containing protein [Egibacteraceae bacterium]
MVELPLFPLHLVLFPGRTLHLHIFEPRYRQLLADSMDGDKRFGVIAIRAGREVGGGAEIYDVGTVAQIESVTALPDGRSEIRVRGAQRFRVVGALNGTPYMRAQIELLTDTGPTHQEVARGEALRELLVPYLAALGAPEELLGRLPKGPDELAYLAAAALQVDVPELQSLLELDSAVARLSMTEEMLRREAGLTRRLGTVGSLRPPGPCGVELN